MLLPQFSFQFSISFALPPPQPKRRLRTRPLHVPILAWEASVHYVHPRPGNDAPANPPASSRCSCSPALSLSASATASPTQAGHVVVTSSCPIPSASSSPAHTAPVRITLRSFPSSVPAGAAATAPDASVTVAAGESPSYCQYRPPTDAARLDTWTRASRLFTLRPLPPTPPIPRALRAPFCGRKCGGKGAPVPANAGDCFPEPFRSGAAVLIGDTPRRPGAWDGCQSLLVCLISGDRSPFRASPRPAQVMILPPAPPTGSAGGEPIYLYPAHPHPRGAMSPDLFAMYHSLRAARSRPP